MTESPTWGTRVWVGPYSSTEMWNRASGLVEEGILLQADRQHDFIAIPRRLSNAYHRRLINWVTRGEGDRPQMPGPDDDDFLSPFRRQPASLMAPGDLQRSVILEHDRVYQSLVRAEALAALEIVTGVDRDLWSYQIPITVLTHEGALAVRHWVTDGGPRPNFAAMTYK